MEEGIVNFDVIESNGKNYLCVIPGTLESDPVTNESFYKDGDNIKKTNPSENFYIFSTVLDPNGKIETSMEALRLFLKFYFLKNSKLDESLIERAKILIEKGRQKKIIINQSPEIIAILLLLRDEINTLGGQGFSDRPSSKEAFFESIGFTQKILLDIGEIEGKPDASIINEPTKDDTQIINNFIKKIEDVTKLCTDFEQSQSLARATSFSTNRCFSLSEQINDDKDNIGNTVKSTSKEQLLAIKKQNDDRVEIYNQMKKYYTEEIKKKIQDLINNIDVFLKEKNNDSKYDILINYLENLKKLFKKLNELAYSQFFEEEQGKFETSYNTALQRIEETEREKDKISEKTTEPIITDKQTNKPPEKYTIANIASIKLPLNISQVINDNIDKIKFIGLNVVNGVKSFTYYPLLQNIRSGNISLGSGTPINDIYRIEKQNNTIIDINNPFKTGDYLAFFENNVIKIGSVKKIEDNNIVLISIGTDPINEITKNKMDLYFIDASTLYDAMNSTNVGGKKKRKSSRKYLKKRKNKRKTIRKRK